MILAKDEWTYQCKALTDLWTGSVDINRNADRLVTTGLLGSIRWWFEVLVRGLGGSACDPNNTKCEDRKHCVVCEFFGCTGWGRKFRFGVLDENKRPKVTQIKKDKTFSLRFMPLRPIRCEEWALLDATLHLIAEYGAIGGKTVFKPTDEPDRASKAHHGDYGLIEITQTPQFERIELEALKTYVSASQWREVDHKDFDWASLKHFWYVKGEYLRRQNINNSSFNQVIGRKEPKNRGQQLANGNDRVSTWLAGSQQESKKVFSFKNKPRTFGFVKPGLIDFNKMKQKLENSKVWEKNGWDFFTGEKIINQLFAGKEDRL